MTKAGRKATAALMAALTMMVAGRANAQGEPIAAIRIVTTNEAAVPQEILASAQIQATQIFARAGITLTWKEGPPVAFSVLLMIVSRSTSGQGDDAMGFAVKGGRVAGVLYRRAADFAERHQIELATVLGHVLAHELGHLLLADRPHSSNGIMRGHWERAHVLAIMRSRSGLMFSTEEAELIRRRIETATH